MHHSQTQHFHLETPQKAVALPLVAGDMVHVTQGCVWLTLEGHARDVWLSTHDAWCVPLDAKLWFSAETAAVFTVSSQLVPPSAKGVSTPRPRVPALWVPGLQQR